MPRCNPVPYSEGTPVAPRAAQSARPVQSPVSALAVAAKSHTPVTAVERQLEE